jgi:outer membrane protein assembly factor BamB/tetratricopeptide (TPR) repeat protein
VVLAWSLLAIDRNIFAQAPDAEKSVINVFRPAPRELVLRLTRAKKAIDNEDYNEAVGELGRLLADLERPEERAEGDQSPADSQDYFVTSKSDNGTHVSLKAEVQRLIGSMPAKGREWYEVQFGAEARKLLDDAAATGDVTGLTTASRRYFHTKAGYEATLLLGRHYMDQGQPLAAALCLKRLADSPVAGTYEPELSVLQATCWIQAGSPEKGRQLLEALAKRPAAKPLKVAGQPVNVGRDEQAGLDWLVKMIGQRRLTIAETVDWLMFRGNATRTATTPSDTPLATPRWRVPTVNNPNDERLVDQLSKKLALGGIATMPTVHPLAVSGTVLMRSNDSLIGVDFRTGKRVWVFPWDEMDMPSSTSTLRPNGMQGNAAMREQELRQRLWEDSPFGQLSSDGQAVYFVHGLNYAPTNPMQQQMVVIGPGGRNRMAMSPGNRLVALDVAREGKLLWEIGDPTGVGGGDSRLASAFFLGAPLPLQGFLYCLAEVSGEVRLVAINARTGTLEWQQQLAHLEARNIAMDPLRRLAGATPSYADGVLVCPTSAGAVVAVDVATRSLLWGYQYTQAPPENGRGGVFFPRGMMGQQMRPLGQRWADATVTIADGRVLVTPVESDEIFCLDLLSGKLAWPAQKRGDLLYVGGVYDGKAVMIGKQSMSTLKLADGTPGWSAAVEFPDGGMVTGRGLQSEQHYYVPTSASQLVRVDLKTGKIDQQVRTERPLGNLVCYQDEIVSHGVDGLSTFPMIGPLRKQVAAQLAKNPQDSRTLARLAELQVYDGQRDEALATLRKALELEPASLQLRDQLVQAMLDALQSDFAGHRKLIPEAEKLLEQPAQRERFLRLMAAGLQQAGDYEAAFTMLLKLAAIDASRTRAIGELPPPLEDLSRRHAVRRDRWIQAQLATIYKQVSDEQRTKLDALLVGRQQEATATDKIAALREIVRYYGFHPRAKTARLELARLLIDTESYIEAEMVLAGLERSSDQAMAAGAIVESTRLLNKAGQFEQAIACAQRLSAELAAVVTSEGLTGQQWWDRFQNEWKGQARFTQQSAWPNGKVNLQEGERIGNATYGRVSALAMMSVEGPLPEGVSLTFDAQQNQVLIARDAWGRELVRQSITRSDGSIPFFYYNANNVSHARAIGHLLIAHMGSEVVAINSLRVAGRADEPLRWRTDVLQRLGENDINASRVMTKSTSMPWGGMRSSLADAQGRPIGSLGPCNASGVFFQKSRELVCLEPLSGEVIWSRSDFAPGCELYGDADVLIVIAPDSKELVVLSALDGQELARRPLDPMETRWVGHGRRVLSWTQANGQLTLRLVDMVSGEKLYEQQFPDGSRATIVQGEDVAVMQPDGQFVITSLRDGQVRVRTPLAAEAGLNTIHVLRGSDDYILITNGPIKPNATQVTSVPGSINSIVVNGRLYRFDRQTGKATWTTPATVEQFGLPLEQPSDLPVVIFMRNANNKGRNQSSLLVLDRRDGRTLLQKDEIPVQANFAEILGKPEAATVGVQMGNRTFEFTFTKEPKPAVEAKPDPKPEAKPEAKPN